MSNLQGGLYPKQSHLGEPPCGDSLGEVSQLQWYKYQGFGLPTAATAGSHCHQPSQPRLARFCHHCSLTTPLEPQGWRTWNSCSQRVSWCGRQREIKRHLRHKQRVQRLKMNSKVAGKEEKKHDQQSWGGRWYNPGLFLASGIQIFVEVCLRTVMVPSTKWKEKEGQAYLGGMEFPTWDK